MGTIISGACQHVAAFNSNAVAKIRFTSSAKPSGTTICHGIYSSFNSGDCNTNSGVSLICYSVIVCADSSSSGRTISFSSLVLSSNNAFALAFNNAFNADRSYIVAVRSKFFNESNQIL